MTSTNPAPPHRLRRRLVSTFKLLVALAVVGLGVCLKQASWPLIAALGVVAFAGLSVSGVPLSLLARRLGLFLLVVVGIALSFPLSQGFSAGWDIAFLIVLRATLSLLVGIWLLSVMPLEELLATLRWLRVPQVLVTILAFMHRYVFVLWEELDTMRAARRARTFGAAGWWSRSKLAAQLIGMLIIRSLDRADHVHRAMLARGWDGNWRRLE